MVNPMVVTALAQWGEFISEFCYISACKFCDKGLFTIRVLPDQS